MSDETLKRDDGPIHQGPRQAAPYPLSRLAPAHDLVDVAREIQEADRMLGTVASQKLSLIAKQMRALQEEARAILETAHRDADLHRATCRFQRRPGHTYHFYQKPDGGLYISLLSPDDWRGTPPHTFFGSYRLENDMSWTSAEDVAKVDADRASLKILEKF
ncbi:MAG: DUF2452 domain-containing protein [Polyangiaceae bacterium]|nr:DUF2452 domain-containing protein [Polyangiaceae bacterium]